MYLCHTLKQSTMKNLLIQIQKEFNLSKCDTSFAEINAEIDYIQETYVDEYKDLFTCLVFIN